MKAPEKPETSKGHENMAETGPQKKGRTLERNTAAKEKMAKELDDMGLTHKK
ncbi:MAG: hypothetical protein U9P37_01340 [Pseudomonadota bacterium]|nr:hypothetical protein [Pseudomonadota bacterium]